MRLSELTGEADDEMTAVSLAEAVEVTGLTADSRKVGPGYLFAALPGTRSEGVAWLREKLAQVRNETVGLDLPNSDYYDLALRGWVENFQRANSLEADGKAGVQTLMQLNTVLASDDLPRLSTNHGATGRSEDQ